MLNNISLLYTGSSAIHAVIDCIIKFSLPLNSTSYYHVAADLPTLMAKTTFSHGVLCQCVPSSYTCVAEGGGETTSAAEGVAPSSSIRALDMTLESFQENFLMKHDRMRTLHLTGDMTSSFIEELAMMLRQCGQQSQLPLPHDEAMTASLKKFTNDLSKDDINSNIFKIDENKLKAIDDISVSFSVRNPFQLIVSNPLENTALLLKEAKNKFNAQKGDIMLLSHGNNNQNYNNDVDTVQDQPWNYFKIKLNSSLSDFNFSITQTIDHLAGMTCVKAQDLSTSSTSMCVRGGTVVTEVAWFEEDEEENDEETGGGEGREGLFEVTLFNMPDLSCCSILYEE